jgi:hypothetical protein
MLTVLSQRQLLDVIDEMEGGTVSSSNSNKTAAAAAAG